jgi:hypothetical protein
MYAYYKGYIDKLTQDDMWAIQYLYGRPERLKYELIPTTTTTVKPSVGSAGQPKGEAKDTVDNSSSTHEPLYIFYKKYVWLVNLKDMTYDKELKLIKDYLYFLPDDFQEISHIY